MNARQTNGVDDDAWIDVIVEDRAALWLEIDTWLWRMCLLLIETLVIVAAVFTSQIGNETPAFEALELATMTALFLLIGGGVLISVADFISTRLARLTRWWRRK